MPCARIKNRQAKQTREIDKNNQCMNEKKKSNTDRQKKEALLKSSFTYRVH